MIDHDSDADPMARRLRSERPELSAAELGGLQRRVQQRTARRASGRSSAAMMTACLGLGVLFSGSGTALAVSGLAGDGSALRQQYAVPVTAPSTPADALGADTSPTLGGGGQGAVAGETASGGDAGAAAGKDTAGTPGDQSDAAGTDTTDGAVQRGAVAGVSASGGEDASGTPSGTDAADTSSSSLNPTGQIAATQGADGELPFTGLNAIPLLLMGVMLLIVGMTMRRRTRTSPF